MSPLNWILTLESAFLPILWQWPWNLANTLSDWWPPCWGWGWRGCARTPRPSPGHPPGSRWCEEDSWTTLISALKASLSLTSSWSRNSLAMMPAVATATCLHSLPIVRASERLSAECPECHRLASVWPSGRLVVWAVQKLGSWPRPTSHNQEYLYLYRTDQRKTTAVKMGLKYMM